MFLIGFSIFNMSAFKRYGQKVYSNIRVDSNKTKNY